MPNDGAMLRNQVAFGTIVTVCALILALSDVAQAFVGCPHNIPVEQKADPPDQWTVGYSREQAELSSATIFDGPPEDRASLKYDDETTTKTEIVQTWELPPGKRGYWIVCGYSNTTAQLRRKLPNDIRTCTVILEKGVTFGDGAPVVKRAECSDAAGPRTPSH